MEALPLLSSLFYKPILSPILQPFLLHMPFKLIGFLNTVPDPQSALGNEQMEGWRAAITSPWDLWVSPSCI